MNIVMAGALGQVFRSKVEPSYRDMLLRHQRAENERRERDEKLEAGKMDDMDYAIAAVTTVAEINAFRVDLDHYDAATVVALQQNEEQLAFIRARIDKLLTSAYVLPDGRRVFKTEDGSQVFDEFGTELDRGAIDPMMIDSARPTWEIYKPELDTKNRLIEERRELIEYQSKLDTARERLDAGNLTREEFDELRDELNADMPSAVRDQLPELEQDAAIKPDAAPAAELEISDEMVSTAPKPSGLVFDR